MTVSLDNLKVAIQSGEVILPGDEGYEESIKR
jgi:hypothetical protein